MEKYYNQNKKTILLLMAITLTVNFGFKNTYAESDCPIEDAPHEILVNYKKVLSKQVSQITKDASEKAKNAANNKDYSVWWRLKGSLNKTKNDFAKIWAMVTNIFNWSWDWGGYLQYFRFYVTMPLTESVPYVIRRDHDFIKSESDKMVKYQKFLIKRWDIESSEKLTRLIVTNDDLLKCYRLQILWLDKWSCDRTFFSTIPLTENGNEVIWDINKFLGEFKQIYKPWLMSSCSKWWVFEEILEKFEDISNTLKWNWSAFKEWQEAWSMLTNPWSKANRKIEKDLLIKELKRQWLSSNAINKMTKDLDKLNSCLDDPKKAALDCVKQNNPFTNTINWIKDSAKELKKGFTDAVNRIDKIADKRRNSTIRENWLKDTSIYQTLSAVENKLTKEWTQAEIEQLYNFNLSLIDIPDWATKELEWKVIDAHINLNRAIKILNDTIAISQKVCNAQHSWVWICK